MECFFLWSPFPFLCFNVYVHTKMNMQFVSSLLCYISFSFDGITRIFVWKGGVGKTNARSPFFFMLDKTWANSRKNDAFFSTTISLQNVSKRSNLSTNGTRKETSLVARTAIRLEISDLQRRCRCILMAITPNITSKSCLSIITKPQMRMGAVDFNESVEIDVVKAKPIDVSTFWTPSYSEIKRCWILDAILEISQ